MAQNQLLEKTVEILSAYLGAMVAKSSIKLHCKNLGIEPEALDKSSLPRVATEIQKGLTVFVGADKAKVISEQISALGG
jgi:hypothetical protein